MNYKIIASCSSGNAVIIKDIILIDCGNRVINTYSHRPL